MIFLYPSPCFLPGDLHLGLTPPFTSDVHFDHVIKAVSARLLHYKGAHFPLWFVSML